MARVQCSQQFHCRILVLECSIRVIYGAGARLVQPYFSKPRVWPDSSRRVACIALWSTKPRWGFSGGSEPALRPEPVWNPRVTGPIDISSPSQTSFGPRLCVWFLKEKHLYFLYTICVLYLNGLKGPLVSPSS